MTNEQREHERINFINIKEVSKIKLTFFICLKLPERNQKRKNQSKSKTAHLSRFIFLLFQLITRTQNKAKRTQNERKKHNQARQSNHANTRKATEQPKQAI